jgi:hypothetical protein
MTENIGTASGVIELDLTPLRRAVEAASTPLKSLQMAMERAGKAADSSARQMNRPRRELDSLSKSLQASTRASERALRDFERLDDAQRRAALAAANHSEKVEILDRALRGAQPGTVRYYRLLEQKTRAEQAAARASEQHARAARTSGQAIGGMRGSVSGLADALGALGVAFGAAEIVRFGIDAARAANRLETTEASVRALAGTQQTYNEIVRLAREQQRLYGGSLAENINQLGSLANAARNAGVSIAEINSIAQRLLVLDPSQNYADATIALREALAGDVTSLRERFEISRRATAALTNEALTGAEKLEILNDVLNEQGATLETVGARAETTAQTYRDLGVAWSNATTQLGAAISEGLEGPASGLETILTRMAGQFDAQTLATQRATDAYAAYEEASAAVTSASAEVQAQYAAESQELDHAVRQQAQAIENYQRALTTRAMPGGSLLVSDEDLDAARENMEAWGRTVETTANNIAYSIQVASNQQVAAQERTQEATQAAARAMEEQALVTAFAAGDIDAALQIIQESAVRSEDEIKAATRALEQMTDTERELIQAQAALTEIDADYAEQRADTLQELADAEQAYQERLASIAADESGAIQDAYEERNEAIADSQRELGETLTDISKATNARLAEMAAEGARREAEARRRVGQRIGSTLADARVAAEVNDLAAVGSDDASIPGRERRESQRFAALQGAQQEAQRWMAQGESELAGEQFEIREQGIEDRLALEQTYAEQRARLLEDGRMGALAQLDKERQEALEAIQAREDFAINIAHEAAQQRQRQRQEERRAIIEEGNIRKAAAQEAAQAQIAAAEQAAQRQIEAAREAASIQRSQAQERITEERSELAEQAAQELDSYEARRERLETTLNEQLVAYGEYYGQALDLNEREQQALTARLQEEYNVQEQALNESLQRRLEATRAFAAEQGQIVSPEERQRRRTIEPGTGLQGMATGGVMLAGRAYETGEGGREIVIPRVDSTILPNAVSERVLAAASTPMEARSIRMGDISVTNNINGVVIDNSARLQELAATIEARTRESTWEQMSRALDSITMQEVW